MHQALRRLTLLASLCSVAIFCLIAGRADQPAYAREGAFVGGGFTYAIEQFDFDDVQGRTGIDFDASDGFGFDLRGGYRFHPNFALEGSTQLYMGINIEPEDRFAGWMDDPDVIGFALAANAKGYPFTGRIQPYGLFGFGVGFFSIDFAGDEFEDDDWTEEDASFLLRFGGGVDFYITPSVLIFAEASYNYLVNDLDFGGPGIRTDLIPVTIGAQYHFGRSP